MLTFKISLQNYLDVFQESIELLIQRAASLYNKKYKQYVQQTKKQYSAYY